MNTPDELDLMVDALDLLGKLNYPQLVTVTALMQAMLPPRRYRVMQAERIQAHVAQLDGLAADRLAALLSAIGGDR